MLIEAFTSIENIEGLGWKLKIVGPIEEEFNDYINNYFKNNPKMKDIVSFTGAIQNREELFNEYKKAKIFSLTSNFESFGIAFIEAASLGDVIISTDVGIAKELISKGNGAVVDTEDVEALKRELKKYMIKDNLKNDSEITYEIVRENFNWDNIINELNDSISKFFK
ncbi:glycosyltransferase [Clostridium novyi]|nr:glycosyltransferase [Clostridium novyi]